MDVDIKQRLHVLGKFFSNSRKRISLVVSIFLMLLLSIVVISSVIISEQTLEKLGQSEYFQSKVNKALKSYELSSEGVISIKFNKFGRADVNVAKASLLNFSDLFAYNVTLKVDFIKYWLGLSFIDEVIILKLVYDLSNNPSIKLNQNDGLDLKFLSQYFYDSMNKIKSKSIRIEEGMLRFQAQTLDFRNISILKNEKFLTMQANLNHKLNAKKTAFSAVVNLSLNKANILKFSIDLKENNFSNFNFFEKFPKIVRYFLGRNVREEVSSEKKLNEIKFAGTYDLNSTIFSFNLTDPSRQLKFYSMINILESTKRKSLLFTKAEMVLQELSLLLSDLNINLSDRSFNTKVAKITSPKANIFGFLNNVTIRGIFPSADGTVTKVKILGEDPSYLNANLEIAESTNRSINEGLFFDFLIQLKAFQKTDLDKFGSSFHPFSIKENTGIKISNAKAQISLKFRKRSVEVLSFEGKIKKLIYHQNNTPIAELENIDLNGNLIQAFASINSLKMITPPTNTFKDIKIELSPTENIEFEREITVTFKSKIKDLISLIPIPENNLTWVEVLTSSDEEKEVTATYSKVIALNEIDEFFTPEGTMFELNVRNLSVPLSAKNTINFATLNVKGIGDTIFFDGVTAAKNRKISGSIDNVFTNMFGKGRPGNLVVFIDNFHSKEFFPEFSAITVQGSIKLTFLSQGNNGKSLFLSDINLTKALVYIPSLSLEKMKGSYGHLKFNMTKDYKSSFQYSQNNVLVSGNATHKTIFDINKVDYSIIKTPDILIKGATFRKFEDYNQFKTNKGSISLDFLMSLSIKKKKVPLDIIFSDIDVNLDGSIFLESLKGELRSFEGLRGYAKAKLSSLSNFEVIISPREDNTINLVISGSDAGELLRRGDYYKNGYGGIFKASILYKNKTNIEGSLEIEDFRIKNAPILAQIISSASIIGLLDNLNGNGLLFTKIEGSFDYKGDKLYLKDGVAVGPSLGLTMGGYERYGKNENVVDVKGLVSPVYIINGVVKAIPLIGKVLGGEKGEGVFGVSYKVQGNSSNPSVSVNPLSILTPGVFRKIFSIEENGNK